MAKHLNKIIACLIVFVLATSVYAADEAPVNTETAPTTNVEGATTELVLGQAELDEEDDSDNDRPEGDDDFIPSSQISEDLSVSFPVDI